MFINFINNWLEIFRFLKIYTREHADKKVSRTNN